MRRTLFAALALTAAAVSAEVVSFKDAGKIKSWDAWSDHKGADKATSVLAKEKRCVTWEKFRKTDPGLELLGTLKTRTSAEIKGSQWSIGCETMDRDYADWNSFKELVPMLGVKHARFFSGWAKTEQEKGKYDFTWLDPHIRECAAMGVKPWICISYGNPVWGSDFRLGMRVKQVTGDPEAFAAWIRYTKALVERYKDVVDEWEVWNEPFGQGDDYAIMFYETAKAVREVQPTAQIFCTAITYSDKPEKCDYFKVLEKLKAENALDLGSYFIYHPYSPRPEATFTVGTGQFVWQPALGMEKLIKEYSPKFRIMQGETGCPSQLEFAHAMHSLEWTEYSQAKWNLRRAIGDAVRSIPSSCFTMIDLKYTFMLQSFGLVRSNLLEEFVYRRPSWYAMRNVYALFDDDTLPGRISEVACGGRMLSSATFTRFGKGITVLWFSDQVPDSSLAFSKVDLTTTLVPSCPRDLAYSDPVWVELVTGRVYRLKDFKAVPMWDSPIIIADAETIPLATETEKKGN